MSRSTKPILFVTCMAAFCSTLAGRVPASSASESLSLNERNVSPMAPTQGAAVNPGPTTVPLDVRILRVSPESQQVDVLLTNLSSRPVTAWNLTVSALYSDDYRAETGVSTDIHVRVPATAATKANGALNPGESLQRSIPLIARKTGSLVAANVSCDAVVFLHAEAEGSIPAIDRILRAREARVDALERALSEMRATESANDPMEDSIKILSQRIGNDTLGPTIDSLLQDLRSQAALSRSASERRGRFTLVLSQLQRELEVTRAHVRRAR